MARKSRGWFFGRPTPLFRGCRLRVSAEQQQKEEEQEEDETNMHPHMNPKTNPSQGFKNMGIIVFVPFLIPYMLILESISF